MSMFRLFFRGLMERFSSSTQTYLISARTYDTYPVRMRVEAYSVSHALLTAQELFPRHICSAAELEPEWGESA
jgi:hypothetical protein